MISDLQKILNQSFFQEISEECGFGKWDKKKTTFYLDLTPELLSYSIDGFDEGIGYSEHYSKKLKTIRQIGVVNKYEKLSSIGYKKGELVELLVAGPIGNFDYLCDENCGTYHLEYDINKLNLLKVIIYDTKNIKHNCSLGLLKAIVKVICNENLKHDSIDIEVLIDYLKIDNEKYIFYDFEILTYALSTYKRLYIARLVYYLLEIVSDENKNLLLSSLKFDNNFHFFIDKHVSDIITDYNRMDPGDQIPYLSYIEECEYFDDLLILTGQKQGNIYYYETINTVAEDKTIGSNYDVTYNHKTKILDYNGRKISFTDSPVGQILIEELYKNIGQWITKSYLKSKGFKSDLKSTKDNIFRNNFTELSSLDKKKLIIYFKSEREEYIMMVGL